ncbi:MAG: aldehyde dehydrogenase family protein, partial [Chloroflexi bacterium]|nr:aldehyde dehydrogenase family protein [Chloroflexota bacterium]
MRPAPEELIMVLSTVTEFQLLIGGQWVPSSSGQTSEVRSPATGAVVGRVAKGTAADVARAVLAARAGVAAGRGRHLWVAGRVALRPPLA